MNIPRCMSTQHPDNVNIPFFAESAELAGEDEIREAYYAFSHLGCDEQMWDCEGKEVDNFVIKKLLTQYETFFRQKVLGKDLFLTLRVPNPTVESAEAKVLLETLDSIPRSFDAAKLFYQDDVIPIFEVILPMTSSHHDLDRIYHYYSDFVVGKQNEQIRQGDITVAEWIGKFNPQKINVIPLFEDMEQMLNSHTITKAYLADKKLEYQRVFLARSDPAMNYGLVTAVLLNKVALQRLHWLSKETGVKIYPIVGVGSAPFRGNLRPQTVDRVLNEYPGVHTFTIQSAFKYDNAPAEVSAAIKALVEREPTLPREVDERRCLEISRKYSQEFQRQIVKLAPLINYIAKYVPGRRKRKLHIGLFGYSRSIGEITLPRAITFTAALYSIGLPPEIFALNVLDKDDLRFLSRVYVHFEEDLKDALQYYNPENSLIPKDIDIRAKNIPVSVRFNKEHREMTEQIIDSLKNNKTDNLGEYILRAAHIRNFLG